MTPLQQPLDGITVLAFEHAIAAPLCTRQLADLGARVIKIERRDGGDFARSYDTRVKGLSSHFVWTNRGKQSLCLDFKRAESAKIVDRLLERSDVLVQNLAPGALHRAGVDSARLERCNPRLVRCNITGYGDAGPEAGRKAYDLLVQAESGFLSVTGHNDELCKAGISIADIAAGTQAYGAILAALLQRQTTGSGVEINISMLDAMVEWMGFPLYYAYDGQPPPQRSGTDHASIYPYGVFACADGQQILLGVQNQREWQRFCDHVLQSADLATDPDFADNDSRSANRARLKAHIGHCFASLDSQAVSSRLDQAAIAWSRVNTLEQVWNHPQLRQRQRYTGLQTPAGPVETLIPPILPPESANPGPVPALGQHSDQILGELGFTSAEITEFRRLQVI